MTVIGGEQKTCDFISSILAIDLLQSTMELLSDGDANTSDPVITLVDGFRSVSSDFNHSTIRFQLKTLWDAKPKFPSEISVRDQILRNEDQIKYLCAYVHYQANESLAALLPMGNVLVASFRSHDAHDRVHVHS